ncbi:hemerythrin domain-containing protein [Actinosynnema sp. NPDC049800]
MPAAIDVAVILNALRALRSPVRRHVTDEADRLLHRFAHEHGELLAARNAVRQAADALSDGACPEADAAIRRAHHLLAERILPHERAEETELYPALVGLLSGPESTVTMSRGHAEIERLGRRLDRHLRESPDGIEPEQVDDVRATLSTDWTPC